MAQLSPYINFNGKCREAMSFYKECLGGDLTLMAVKDSPMAGTSPAHVQDQIMHSMLRQGELVLMGTDMQEASIQHTTSNSIALSLNCHSEEEIKNYFSKLSAGGKITHELSVEFWGGTFGTFTDKYGFHWMLNYEPKKS